MPRSSSYSNDDRLPLCNKCGGIGQILDPRNPEKTIVCPKCGGSGRKTQNNASGTLTKKKRNDKKAKRKARKKELKEQKTKIF